MNEKQSKAHVFEIFSHEEAFLIKDTEQQVNRINNNKNKSNKETRNIKWTASSNMSYKNCGSHDKT